MDAFQFYWKSKHAPVGEGKGEVVRQFHYDELNQIQHWRRMLSVGHIANFTYEGKTYESIEQCYREISGTSKIDWEDPKLECILYEKYMQHRDVIRVLKLTNSAELWHYIAGAGSIRFFALEKTRSLFQLYDKFLFS